MCGSDNKVLVLADDFTGANDAGVGLAEAGMRVDVVFGACYQGDAQALVLNSDSRALVAEQAAKRVETLLQQTLTGFRPRWTVKKIDSTLRGNIGSEIAAMMRALGYDTAVLAPAYPAAGRVIRDGNCYVYDELLTRTEFASDPKTPVNSASVATLVSQQSSLSCRILKPDALAEALNHPHAGDNVLIVDAAVDADLDAIVASVALCERRVLLVGSAGLCEALARRVHRLQSGPLLAVVGSMSEIAQRQVLALAGRPRLQRLDIDVAHAFIGNAQQDAMRIAHVIAQGDHCIVTTTTNSAERLDIDAQCQLQGLSRAEYGEQICRYLADAVGLALASCRPGALYLSGGDAAIAIAGALNATGFHITGRVAQCVPYGYFLGSHWHGPVLTKAGGFGDETTLSDVVDFIEEKLSD